MKRSKAVPSAPQSRPRLPLRALLTLFAVLAVVLLALSFQLSRLSPSLLSSLSPHSRLTPALLDAHFRERTSALSHPRAWLDHLRRHHVNNSVTTVRTACRELQAAAQTCVFDGFLCANVTSGQRLGRPQFFVIHDYEPDGRRLRSDSWCQRRHVTSDPRYFSARDWPIRNDTESPQRTCFSAIYRNSTSFFSSFNLSAVRWYPSLSLVDLDYVNNNHNNHLVKEIIWLLDLYLFETSLSLNLSPADHSSLHSLYSPFQGAFEHIYLPQSRRDFEIQTARDINRLNYALILRKNMSNLYPNYTSPQMKKKPEQPRETEPLLTAYPELTQQSQLLFHHDFVKDQRIDLVCTAKLTVGAKIGNGAHERVCRSLRQRAHRFFGISGKPKQVGRVYFEQPPKRIVIFQRHLRRSIENVDEVEHALRNTFEKYGVVVDVVDTSVVRTAEEHVRFFSEVGVLITPHGSQAMGQIYMPRHRYVFSFIFDMLIL